MPNRLYSVDVQATHEFTYRVNAASPEDAEAQAKEMYSNDETPDNEEVFDAQVTNCEPV